MRKGYIFQVVIIIALVCTRFMLPLVVGAGGVGWGGGSGLAISYSYLITQAFPLELYVRYFAAI